MPPRIISDAYAAAIQDILIQKRHIVSILFMSSDYKRIIYVSISTDNRSITISGYLTVNPHTDVLYDNPKNTKRITFTNVFSNMLRVLQWLDDSGYEIQDLPQYIFPHKYKTK